MMYQSTHLTITPTNSPAYIASADNVLEVFKAIDFPSVTIYSNLGYSGIQTRYLADEPNTETPRPISPQIPSSFQKAITPTSTLI